MKAFVVIAAVALSCTAQAKQEPPAGQKAAPKAVVETTVKRQWTPSATRPMQMPFLPDETRENALDAPLLKDAQEIRESQTAPRPVP